MAKKDKKKSKKKKDNSGTDPVGAVRTAVERTFQATADSAQSTRTRAQDLVDDVAGAAGRLREMLEQMGPLEDLKKQIDALTSRVAALEKGSSTSTASRSSASRSTKSRTSAKKPAARTRKPAAKASSGTRKPAASRSTASRSTASKSSGTTRKPTRSPAAKKSS